MYAGLRVCCVHRSAYVNYRCPVVAACQRDPARSPGRQVAPCRTLSAVRVPCNGYTCARGIRVIRMTWPWQQRLATILCPPCCSPSCPLPQQFEGWHRVFMFLLPNVVLCK